MHHRRYQNHPSHVFPGTLPSASPPRCADRHAALAARRARPVRFPTFAVDAALAEAVAEQLDPRSGRRHHGGFARTHLGHPPATLADRTTREGRDADARPALEMLRLGAAGAGNSTPTAILLRSWGGPGEG